MTFTDREGNSSFHDSIKQSCALNEVDNAKVMELTWGVFSPTLLALPPPNIILASDCFYCSKGLGLVGIYVSSNTIGKLRYMTHQNEA